MNGSAHSILDLLSGFGAPQTAGSGAKGVSTAEGPDTNFAALLGLLSGIGTNTGTAQMGILPTAQNGQTGTGPTVDSGLFSAQMNALASEPSGLMGIASLPTGSSNQPAGSPSTGEIANNAPNITQLLSNVTSAQVKAVVNQLPDGKYKVLDASISEGKLSLQLQSAGKSSAEVKVSIPVALLQNGSQAETNPLAPLSMRQNSSQNAVQTANATSAPSLTDLLGQLNVSEVNISQTSSPTAQAGQGMTNISFVSAEAAAAPVMTAAIPTAQLKTTMTSAPTTEATAEGSSADADDTASVTPTKSAGAAVSFVQVDPNKATTSTQSSAPADSQPMFRTAAVRVNSKVMTQDSAAISKLLGDSDKGDASLFKSDMTDALLKGQSMTRSNSSTSPTLDQPAVKITLPQNLSSLLDGHGRSINIKLEPDYLGPARLNLTIRGEALTAKLTVETPQAKAAVENSISQLTDQLAKAGIKVDYFDVSMRGGGAGQQSFQRPQEWFTSGRPKFQDSDGDSLVETINKPDSATPLRSSTYLNRRGVNLYA